MNIKKTNLIILIIAALSICAKCNKEIEGTSLSQMTDSVPNLKIRALKNGDTIAYDELSLGYYDSPYDGFLYTALIMANKYNYPQAYTDVFYCLTNYNHVDFDKSYFYKSLDSITRELALRYLKVAAKYDESESLEILEELNYR